MLTAELTVPNGAIRGVPRDKQGVLAFKGIPYAAPPVGELRCGRLRMPFPGGA